MPEPKVVLDSEDMRRTLTRIAHEIVENGGDPERLAIVGIHRRGAVLARRLQELLGEPARPRRPARGPRHLLLPRRRHAARRPSGRALHAPGLRRRRAHDRDRRRRALHRPHGPRRDRGAVRLRAPRARPAGGARRPRPPRAAAAPRLRRQEPADGQERARLRPRPRARRRGQRHDRPADLEDLGRPDVERPLQNAGPDAPRRYNP